MLASEEKLEKALRSTHTRERDQRQRLRWILWVAGSYALDAFFLALFWAAGTVAVGVPLAYASVGVLICGATYAMTVSGRNLKLRDPSLTMLQIGTAVVLQVGVVAAAPQLAFPILANLFTVFAVLASGRNLRLRDPNLGVPQIGAAVLLQLAVVALAPQLAFPFLANLFTVFAFGMTWAPVRQAAVVWSLGVLALGALFYAMGERLALPVATAAERWLVWSYFSLILGRCLMLSVQASELRQRLQDSRRKLSDSLAQVQQLASHDELTRTLNRRALMARLEEQRSRAERFHEAFCVALLDLDHFKAVNDTHGHAAGDAVLRAFAALAQAGLRDSDVFGRYGGEEFMLILGATPLSAVQPPLERIRTELAGREWSAVADGLRVTVSIGVAAYRRGETLEQVLSRADDALYEAKRLGRDRVVTRD